MPFSPTYTRLEENEPWRNEYYNQLIVDIGSALSSLGGADLATPIELSRSLQHLNGKGKNIRGFKRWLGDGSASNSVHDVTGFGAVADGSTDDAAAIQAAINALPNSGGAIIFPPGTYVIKSPIYMAGAERTKENVLLFGAGRSTTIKLGTGFPDSSSAIIAGGKQAKSRGMKIFDMAFDGNDAAFSSGANHSAIDLAATIYADIKGTYIYSIEGNGIIIGGSAHARIRNAVIDACVVDGIAQGEANDMAHNIHITNCMLNGNGENGIHIGPISGGIISGCHASGHTTTHKAGFVLKTAESASCRSVIFRNCISNGNGRGLIIRAGNSKSAIEHVSIVGCGIFSSGGYGIYIVTLDTSDVNAGAIRGLLIAGTQSCQNSADGCLLYGDIKHGTITGSSFCDNNSAVDNYAGLRLIGADAVGTPSSLSHIAVVGNVCSDGQPTPTQLEGIVLEASTEQCAVIGNTLSRNTSRAIRNLGTGNDVSHNQES